MRQESLDVQEKVNCKMTNNKLKLLFVLSTLLLTDVKGSPEPLDRGECLYRFDYDYKVLQKLVSLETKIQTLESGQQSIQKSFSDERQNIEELKDKVAILNETGILHSDNTGKDMAVKPLYKGFLRIGGKSSTTTAVLMDISKALDCFPHEILLPKL